MYIVMLLNGKEVGRNQLLRTSKISKEMEELIKKYRNQIQESGAEPQFVIEQVPSVINDFKSLQSEGKDRNSLAGM